MLSTLQLFRRSALVVSTVAAALLAWVPRTEARVTKIVIDARVSPAFDGQSFGKAGQYETIAGRAFGELDPNDPHNAIIQDIELATPLLNGKVGYMATFFLVKPIDMSRSSHLMWQDVPNRGGRITISTFDRNNGDIGLSSGWQGDNVGGTAQIFPNTNDYVVVPMARNPDGSPITGPLLGRIYNRSGPDSQPIIVYTNPMPYKPATLDTTQALMVTHTSETNQGVITGVSEVPSTDWAWATCDATRPFPGTPNPTQICMRNGFDPTLLYQIVFMGKDPYVLGIGFAAFRDVASFFRYEAQDDFGTPNPVSTQISWIISRGSSQSGNFIREFLHLGFNQDEAGRKVHDGSWPTIAGRRLFMNVRFATPDQILFLYNAGSEGPVWWRRYPDPVRDLPPAGILDRCRASHTCPKIVETFGATEFWFLHMSPDLVGTSADADIPLNANVRRYYIPSTPHGGGPGDFSVTPLAVPSGPGTAFGPCTFAGNPVPHTQTRNALTVGLRRWVMDGTPMVPSRYPTLASGTLAAPTKAAMGFPTIPGVPPNAPDGLINPVLDYDFGPRLNYTDLSGIIDIQPPVIKQEIPMVVPRVDADGNELGGVPVPLRDAPLGTYVGWNITSAGFFTGRTCSYAAGMIPFARTKAERIANNDPRLSLEERYGTHEGYVAAVRAAAANALAQGFLLQADADALVAQAEAGNVLNP